MSITSLFVVLHITKLIFNELTIIYDNTEKRGSESPGHTVICYPAGFLAKQKRSTREAG